MYPGFSLPHPPKRRTTISSDLLAVSTKTSVGHQEETIAVFSEAQAPKLNEREPSKLMPAASAGDSTVAHETPPLLLQHVLEGSMQRDHPHTLLR